MQRNRKFFGKRPHPHGIFFRGEKLRLVLPGKRGECPDVRLAVGTMIPKNLAGGDLDSVFFEA